MTNLKSGFKEHLAGSCLSISATSKSWLISLTPALSKGDGDAMKKGNAK